MMNGVATSIRFLQQNIHERKNFAKNFSIDIIPEPRSFKYYNYLGYFWLACRTIFSLLPFCCRTEIFTTYEKFTDPNAPYKGISDYNIIF